MKTDLEQPQLAQLFLTAQPISSSSTSTPKILHNWTSLLYLVSTSPVTRTSSATINLDNRITVRVRSSPKALDFARALVIPASSGGARNAESPSARYRGRRSLGRIASSSARWNCLSSGNPIRPRTRRRRWMPDGGQPVPGCIYWRSAPSRRDESVYPGRRDEDRMNLNYLRLMLGRTWSLFFFE